jgi:hypothetical protein
MLGDARGTPVRLAAGQPEYLAVVVSYFQWGRSILYVYKPGGALVYQEILGELCDAIAPLPQGGSGAEAILLGGVGRVWKYTLASATP